MQTLVLLGRGKPPDISGLQEVFYALGKIIKDAGRNVDLRIGTVAASRIISSDEMAIPG